MKYNDKKLKKSITLDTKINKIFLNTIISSQILLNLFQFNLTIFIYKYLISIVPHRLSQLSRFYKQSNLLDLEN